MSHTFPAGYGMMFEAISLQNLSSIKILKLMSVQYICIHINICTHIFNEYVSFHLVLELIITETK